MYHRRGFKGKSVVKGFRLGLAGISILFLFFTSLPMAQLEAAPNEETNLCPIINLLLGGFSFGCSVSVDEGSEIYDIEYKGLRYYEGAMGSAEYTLEQLSDDEFLSLSRQQQLRVADKLLSTLFYGYSNDALEAMIDTGTFLCTIRSGLASRTNSVQSIEDYILDPLYFAREDYYKNEINDILARLYVMEDLDEYFLHNWIAYILTQTIMFSPAEELDSAHLPDVANVYNWLVMDMEEDVGLRYSTYLHMQSLENWRRFRSPEDNGREMLEIFMLDFDDQKVPITATALQNWYLDEDHDSLVIGLNENTTPLQLFQTEVVDGFDFYRELVKTNTFINGVTSRLVDFFLPRSAVEQKERVVEKIVASNPERWQDILLQLVFSREYLLYSEREKSAEELFFSLARKLPFKHYKRTINTLTQNLEYMNQASMKYKLGKLERTPLDTLSFANYHRYFRYDIILDHVCGEALTGYAEYYNEGWTPELIADRHFSYVEGEPEASMTSFIQYLFEHLIQREANEQELDLFLDTMLRDNRTRYQYSYNLSSTRENGCYYGRENAAYLIMDYLTRLTTFYWFEGVD